MTFKFYIDRWLSGGSRRSFALLERLSGVPNTTLRRLYDGDGSHGSKSTIPVAAIVCSTDEARDLINELHPEIEPFFSTVTEKVYKTAPEVFNPEILKSKESYFIICLSYAGVASSEQILTMFGEFGLRVAEDLIRAGTLDKREGKYIPADGQSFIYGENHDLVAQQVSYIAGAVRRDSKHDYNHTLVFSTSDEGLKETEEAMREFSNKINLISQKYPESKKHVVALATAYARLLEGNV